jgi:plasmid stabilization system protein ParE
MNFRITPRARADLHEIRDYIYRRSPSGARNVLRSIHAGIAFIAEQPRGGTKTDEGIVRVKVITDYPYKIFYRIEADTIEIVHIRHSARRAWSGATR